MRLLFHLQCLIIAPKDERNMPAGKTAALSVSRITYFPNGMRGITLDPNSVYNWGLSVHIKGHIGQRRQQLCRTCIDNPQRRRKDGRFNWLESVIVTYTAGNILTAVIVQSI